MDQIHLTLWGPTSMLVSWAAGDAILGPGNKTPSWPNDAVQAVVQYSSNCSCLDLNATGGECNTADNLLSSEIRG